MHAKVYKLLKNYSCVFSECNYSKMVIRFRWSEAKCDELLKVCLCHDVKNRKCLAEGNIFVYAKKYARPNEVLGLLKSI